MSGDHKYRLLLFFLTFGSEQNSQCIGAAMAGNGTAGLGDVNIVKLHFLFHSLPHRLNILGVDAGMGNEDFVGSNVWILGELFFRILNEYVFQLAPVFFAYTHAAAGVVHFNAGLEL